MNNQGTNTAPQDEFARVALLTGRPLYWRTNENDAVSHAKAVYQLIQFFLDMPEGSLGVKSSTKGETWDWLDHQSAQQWNDETLQKFEYYASQLPNALSESQVRSDFNERHCMFFAPFHPQSFLSVLQQHLSGSSSGESLYLDIKQSLDSIDWSHYSLFWSYSLNQFSASQDALVYTPMLALWSSYPKGGYWAPPPPNNLAVQLNLSLDEARFLLEEVMWKKLETVFTYIRFSCGLGAAEPKFAKSYEAKSPVFYFAQYVNPPSCPEDLATKKLDSLYALVKTCLGSDDPFAQEVSGGVLEGDFVTLRRAQAEMGTYQPWYLIFPIDKGRILTEQELERDVFLISNSLSYLEFTISHESRDISTDLDPLRSRLARWGGTFDELIPLINNVINFIPTISGGLLKKVYLEIERLMLPLRQIQSSIETVTSDVAQLQRKYDGYKDSTKDFWDRRFTYSPCINTRFNDLREAMVDAYPYRYLEQPLQSLKESNEQLLGTVERVGHSVEMVNSVLQQADRRTQESLEVWTRRLGIIAALAAPALALPSFIDLKLNTRTFPNTVFGKIFHSWQEFETLVGGLLSLALVLLFLASISFVISWLGSLFSKRKAEQFISGIRSFESLLKQSNEPLQKTRQKIALLKDIKPRLDLLNSSSSQANEANQLEEQLTQQHTEIVELISKLDQLDTEATQILSHLWEEALNLQTADSKSDWITWLLNTQSFVRTQLRAVKDSHKKSRSIWKRSWLRVQAFSLRLVSRVLTGLLAVSTRLEPRLSQFDSKDVYEWLRQSQYFRYLVYLFDLTPNYIPLPRALCVYRYKADDFIARTTISNWDFERSLRSVGFDTEMIQHLEQWLQELYDRGGIRSISIDDFVDSLEQRGVRAYPEQQAVEQWHGFLDGGTDS